VAMRSVITCYIIWKVKKSSQLTCMDLTLKVHFQHIWITASCNMDSWLVPSFIWQANGGLVFDNFTELISHILVPLYYFIICMLYAMYKGYREILYQSYKYIHACMFVICFKKSINQSRVNNGRVLILDSIQ